MLLAEIFSNYQKSHLQILVTDVGKCSQDISVWGEKCDPKSHTSTHVHTHTHTHLYMSIHVKHTRLCIYTCINTCIHM